MNKLSFFTILLGFFLFAACSNDSSKPDKSKPKRIVKKAIKNTNDEKPTKKEVVDKEEKSPPQTTPTPKEHLDKAKEIIAGVKDSDVDAIDAKKKFKMLCATCHGFTGDLNVNGAKDLTKSKISLTESVAQVYHGKGLMTPFKGIMTDAEIVAVAKYIETLRK